MKTTIFAAALLLSGSAYAAEGDLQPWSQATPENLQEAAEVTCGRYEGIKDYKAEDCAGKIFEDIETDAANGGSE